MMYRDVDALAWEAVKTIHDRFLGRKSEPTDDDWRQVIADAIEKAIGPEWIED